MNSSVCKYSLPDYWEATLIKKDVWNGLFGPSDELGTPIFVNTCVIDSKNKFIDNNWACYPDMQALLGFVQFIFLPTVFYHLIDDWACELITPICSEQELLTMILGSRSPHRMIMVQLEQLAAVWDCEESQRQNALEQFCRQFNLHWHQQGRRVALDVYFGVSAVADKVKSVIWCDELFAEETGFTVHQFNRICDRFKHDAIAKHILMRVLNHGVGCII